MSTTMLQIRKLTPDLHRRLKIRAATEGVSMSEFVLREIRKSLDRPSRAEVLARIRAEPVRNLGRRAADLVRADRDSR